MIGEWQPDMFDEESRIKDREIWYLNKMLRKRCKDKDYEDL